MNILYLTTHLNIGGITSYLLSLAIGLKKRGHNICLASGGGELQQRFIDEGIAFISIPIKTKSEISPKVLFSLFKLLPYIKDNNIDIIHSNTRVANVLACLLGSILHKPFVSTCHGFFKRRFSRRIFPCWGRKVIAISEQVKRHLIDDFKIKEEDIRVINNGVDIDRFRIRDLGDKSEKKIKFGLRKESRIVGIIARLSDVKGHIYLIRAMRKVLEAAPDVQLFVVGEGKMSGRLAALVKELKMEQETVIIPSVMDTREALSVMDIFVMPSLNEGLGISLMEAMAAGTAVIGSDVGGIKSLIQDNHNGILVKPADVEGIFSAIKGLLENSRKRESLAVKAREYISAKFSLYQMLSLTERVYQECVNL